MILISKLEIASRSSSAPRVLRIGGLVVWMAVLVSFLVCDTDLIFTVFVVIQVDLIIGNYVQDE